MKKGRRSRSRQDERGLGESESLRVQALRGLLMYSGLTWDEENLAATEIGKDSLM